MIDYIILLVGIRSNLKEQQLSPTFTRTRLVIRMCLFWDEPKNELAVDFSVDSSNRERVWTVMSIVESIARV